MRLSVSKNEISGMCTTLVVLVCLIFTGCTVALKSSNISMDEYMKRHNESELYHAIRFESFGGAPQKLYGYFLYKHPVEVGTVVCQFERIEKISFKHVLADYDRVTGAVMDANVVKPGPPVIREFYRNDAVVGYSVLSIGHLVTVWDSTPAISKKEILLELGCTDQRGTSGAPMGLFSR